MKRIKLLFIITSLPLFAFAGGGMRQADREFAAQEYYLASADYHNAQASGSISKADKIRADFQLAECDRMLSKWTEALNYYTKAKNENYVNDIVWLRMAQMQQMLGQYQNAINSYGEYQKRVPSDLSANVGIQACVDAIAWLAEPNNRWELSNESELNTKTNDFCPTWSDKKHFSLVFSSKRPGQTGSNVDPNSGGMYSDLFEAKKSNTGKWSTPTTVQGDVNLPTSNDGASCITKSGNHIFFTRCDQKKKNLITCKIFYAEKKGAS